MHRTCSESRRGVRRLVLLLGLLAVSVGVAITSSAQPAADGDVRAALYAQANGLRDRTEADAAPDVADAIDALAGRSGR